MKHNIASATFCSVDFFSDTTHGVCNLQPHRHPHFHSTRNVKLDFSKFDGLNCIFKSDEFFDYYSTHDAQRITIAAIHMEKDVVPWFQMMTKPTLSNPGPN